MDLPGLILYVLLTITLLQALRSILGRNRARSNLPPGPAPLPVIGNLLKLGNKPHESMAKLAKTHGPIMTLKLGQKTAVVISSSALAKEVLQKHDLAFSSRTIPNAAQAGDHHKYSVIWLPVSDRWRSLRKIVASTLFTGSRLDASQNLRQEKVKELISYAEKCYQDGVAMDIGRAVFMTSLNMFSNTVFSIDLVDLSLGSAKEFRDLFRNISAEVGKPNLVDYFPVLAKIDPQGTRKRMTVHVKKLNQFFGRLIDERLNLRKLHKTNVEKDVLDILLNLSHEIDRTHIEHMFSDLFIAATDTTSSTIEWAMTELLRNPELLKKAKSELEQTIGKGRLIKESDISQLPYLRSIVKETMRVHPSTPLLLHKAEADVEVYGFTVPKGTQVLINVWAIGKDPSIWKNSATFMPDRFLESEVDVRGQDFELIPFGAGRRICPGLPLAMRMVPVVLGSLINSFDWKLEDGILSPDMEDKFGLTLQKAQPLRAIPLRICDN